MFNLTRIGGAAAAGLVSGILVKEGNPYDIPPYHGEQVAALAAGLGAGYLDIGGDMTEALEAFTDGAAAIVARQWLISRLENSNTFFG